MANYILFYDPTAPSPQRGPSFEIALAKAPFRSAKLMDRVWHIASPLPLGKIYDALSPHLGAGERLLLIEAKNAEWQGLQVADQALKGIWGKYRA